jgi:hypothetical protein
MRARALDGVKAAANKSTFRAAVRTILSLTVSDTLTPPLDAIAL